jgi:hypothetical protein
MGESGHPSTDEMAARALAFAAGGPAPPSNALTTAMLRIDRRTRSRTDHPSIPRAARICAPEIKGRPSQ